MRNARLLRGPHATTSGSELSYAESLERVPESAAAARRLVETALHAWGLAHLTDHTLLVVTELASNAIRHADGEGMRVSVTRLSDHRVRVGVTDRDRTRPQINHSTPDQERGRGLLIVDSVSSLWGVDVLPGGKHVWADLEPQPTDREAR
jgi:serine/threonine-protein kinase RsbW